MVVLLATFLYCYYRPKFYIDVYDDLICSYLDPNIPIPYYRSEFIIFNLFD